MSAGEAFFLVAGDLLPTVDAVLEDENGAPLDLSLASGMQFRLRASGAAAAFVIASCAFSVATVGGASVGHVTHAWGPTTVPTVAGLYEGQFRATFPGSRTLTVPNPGFLSVTVGAAL